MQDVATILGARHVILSTSTFSKGIALMSKRIRTVYASVPLPIFPMIPPHFATNSPSTTTFATFCCLLQVDPIRGPLIS